MCEAAVTLVNPVGHPRNEDPIKEVAWPVDLSHKTVILIDNTKPKADLILELFAGAIQEHFPGVRVIHRRKSGAVSPAPFLHELNGMADLAINAVAD
ncbi:MAG: hypothetical protein HYX87_05395 [Chloroflexi bacterium]|nr:hypothetical protein [Chloroflexota bacterium]